MLIKAIFEYSIGTIINTAIAFAGIIIAQMVLNGPDYIGGVLNWRAIIVSAIIGVLFTTANAIVLKVFEYYNE